MKNRYTAIFSIVLGVLLCLGSAVLLSILITPYPWLAVFGVENPLFFSIMVAGIFCVLGVFLIREWFIFFRKKPSKDNL